MIAELKRLYARNGAALADQPLSVNSDAFDAFGGAMESLQNARSFAQGMIENASGKAPEGKREGAGDHSDPALYLNRELSWLKFNWRVLNEACDPRNALLERVKFLAIVSSNIDEFYMKRIGGLRLQMFAGVTRPTVDGRTPEQCYRECIAELTKLQDEKNDIYHDLIAELRDHGIVFASYSDLSEPEKKQLRQDYIRETLPLLTPLSIDISHPFPFISNLSLNLLLTLREEGGNKELQARVKIPVGTHVPRFVKVGTEHRFVFLEDLVVNNLDLLFPQMEIVSCDLFRITRNANTNLSSIESDDLLEMMESRLRHRKFAPVVRLQTGAGMDETRRQMLAQKLGLDEDNDTPDVDAMIWMSDLMEIAALDIPDLKQQQHRPVDNAMLREPGNIFDAIRRRKQILLQHPFESFSTSVERFVSEASRDPKVAAIKTTLYRTSADTKIIQYLIDAARNGKQVAVVVELQARFDEAANIGWASRLEEAGIHVNYGVVGLKTHCKVIHVVRRDDDGLRSYAHIGTGNYHAGTARLYSDIGLLTCEPELTGDLSELFNYLTTGCNPGRTYTHILTAPLTIKKALLEKIEREIRLSSDHAPGLIRLKTNALEDADIAEALYRASTAGVKIEMVIRDICRLRPGIRGHSENIRVVSIVGRFLEHSRVYYFRNGGDEEYYIGSADLMTRNLEQRVEILVPVNHRRHRAQLNDFLEGQLSDGRNAWEMEPDGGYVQRVPKSTDAMAGCQERAIKAAATRLKMAGRQDAPNYDRPVDVFRNGAGACSGRRACTKNSDIDQIFTAKT